METYRLSSKLVENQKEFVIRTSNDVKVGAVLSTVYVNGRETETVRMHHPSEISAEEVLSIVKKRHDAKKREIETMLNTYRRVIEGGDPKAMFQLGTAFFYKSLLSEARDLFQGALHLDSGYHKARSYLGRTQLALGNTSAAITLARAAVNQQPKYADYRYYLAEALLQEGLCSEAVGEYEEAVHINMYYGDAHFGLGLSLLLNAINRDNSNLFSGILSRTADCIKKAAMIDAEYEGELHTQGLGALERSELSEAFGLLRKLYQEKQESRRAELSQYYMKYVYHQNELNEETLLNRIDFLKAEVAKHPDYVDLHLELSQCHARQAFVSWEKALNHGRRAFDINPAMPGIDEQLNSFERELENLKHLIDQTNGS